MVFFIEGNIGAGKSTLLRKLEELNINIRVIYEPVDSWMNMKAPGSSESLFELYYKDKARYGFMFQMVALQSRIAHIIRVTQAATQSNENTIIVCERSFLTDHEIFAKMLHNQKVMSDEEYYVYKMWYDFFINLLKPCVHGIIYLRTSPDTCYTRMQKRNRHGEEGVQLEYLEELHEQHENWLWQPQKANTQTQKYLENIFIVNGDVENLEITNRMLDFLQYSVPV